MRKRVIYLGLIFLALIGLGFYIRALKIASDLRSKSAQESVLGSEEKVSVFKDVVKQTYERPKRIFINLTNSNDISVELSADLIEVSVTPDGTLEAPDDWYVAGWYKDGALAGEPGNLVIDGHYDTSWGSPAAFWNLKYVKTGDIVTIVDEVERKFRYEVREVLNLDINDPSRLQIFDEKKETAHVTIITCGGVWLSGHSTYSQRLVIKAELVS